MTAKGDNKIFIEGYLDDFDGLDLDDLDDQPQEEQLARGGQLHTPLRFWEPSPLPQHGHQ